MLAIRMQRTGRKGHAQFRLIVQDRRFHPSSGRIVAYLGSYNPHTKQSQFDKDKLTQYLEKGAQPSDRVVKLLQGEKVELPSWVNVAPPKTGGIRNPAKLRRNRPKDAPTEKVEAAEQSEAPAQETVAEEKPAEEAVASAEESTPTPDEETPTEAETPAEAAVPDKAKAPSADTEEST